MASGRVVGVWEPPVTVTATTTTVASSHGLVLGTNKLLQVKAEPSRLAVSVRSGHVL